jgi:hypothetical protein
VSEGASEAGAISRCKSGPGKNDTPEGWKVYAVLVPSNDKWIAAVCSQKISMDHYIYIWQIKIY